MVASWRLFNQKQKLWLLVPIITTGAFIYSGNTILAQVTPDQTLGKESSVVTPVSPNVDRVDAGAVRGSNLFHSFKDFNIGEGRRVDFANPAGVENIFSRVTGGNRSDILGTLGVLGNANLFLLNPNGIIFGPNARLDIKGSFVGTTAESIKFADGSFFSASNPQEVPLLKISIPIGLQIPQNPERITVQGDDHNLTHDQSTNATIRGDVSGLETRPGKTLALVGGDIVFYGGNLRADSGRIELGSVASPGLVNLIQNDSGFTLGYSDIEDFGNIQLSQKASVDVSGEGGGSIQVQSKRLSLKDGSSILSITSGTEPGGNFTVNATESVELIGESIDGKYASSLLTESQGAGTSGNLTVNTGKLTTTDGAYLSTFVTSSGNGGNLTVKASESVELLGKGRFGSGLYTGTSYNSSGNSGELNLETGNLTIKNSAIMYAISAGLGNGGDILIQASDGVSVSDANIISVALNGSSGDIKINANSLSLAENSTLDTSTFGDGNGGDITVNASQNISLTGGSIVSTNTSGNGNGGDITVNANQNISLNGDSIVSSGSFFGKGNAGNIQLTTETFRISDGASIFSGLINAQQGKGDLNNKISNLIKDIKNARQMGKTKDCCALLQQEKGDGWRFYLLESPNAGNIEVNTGSLFLTNGGSISSGVSSNENFVGESYGGNITINARDRINLDGVESFISTALSEGKGRSGNIEVNTGKLSVTNGGELFTSSAGTGNAGNITINARDIITFDGFGISGNDNLVVSSANSFYLGDTVGNGGDISVTGKALFLTNGGNLNAANFKQGNGGNIYLDIHDKVTIDGISNNGISSGLSTFANTKAGDIKLTGKSLTITNGAFLASSTYGQGNAGNISIDIQDRVTLDGVGSNGKSSRILSTVRNQAIGDGGNVEITTNSLSVTNGAQINNSTFGEGNAGDIKINARDTTKFDGVGSNGISSSILSAVGNQAVGDGGNVEITTNSLSVTNGARVNTSTFGEGNAGKIKITTHDTTKFEGFGSNGRSSGIFSIVGDGGTGRGGNLDINSGNLDLDRAVISAITTSGDGGNIKLNIQDVLSMSRGSRITTNAGTAEQGGNGGNIDINSKFIITVPNENSDITANAFEGQGGKINIASEKIFWMEQRDREELIDLLGSSSELSPSLLSTNDITAFSQQNPNLDGLITINLLNAIDPSRGLTSLPTVFVDASDLIDQSCTLSSNKSSSQFVNTGRGGLPTNPSNPLSPNTTITRLATPIVRRSQTAQKTQTLHRTQNSSSSSTIPLPNNQEPESIVEAQGWVRLGNGKIRLVAQAPSVTHQGNWQTMSSCYVH